MAGFFSAYIRTLISVAVCAYICESLTSFTDKNKSLSKALGLICSICIFVVSVFPLIQIFQFTDIGANKIKNTQYKENDDNYSQYLKLVSEDLKLKIENEIFNAVGIKPQDVSIQLSVKDDCVIINEIYLELNSENENSKQLVKDMLKEITSEETKIVFREHKS